MVAIIREADGEPVSVLATDGAAQVINYVPRCLFLKLSERSRIRIYIRLNDVLSTAELPALPRRSERAASGVAQLQGRRGDHHIQADPPDAGSTRNADPDYKQQYEGGRRQKDKDLITQAEHRATKYGDNCEYEQQQPRPRMRMLLFIFLYPCVFCGINTSLVSRPGRGRRSLRDCLRRTRRCCGLQSSQRARSAGFRFRLRRADGVFQNVMGLVDTLHLAIGNIAVCTSTYANRNFRPCATYGPTVERCWY
jgi:hypothetical protein